MDIDKDTAIEMLIRVNPLGILVNFLSFWVFVYILVTTLMHGVFLWEGVTQLLGLFLVRGVLLLPVRWLVRRKFNRTL